MARRGVRWWTEWLSASPGSAIAPSRIETLYRNVAASISRHATAADTALAVALAAGTVPQLVHLARNVPGLFSEVLLFNALLVAPLIWRRRLPLSTFAVVAVVALAQWIVNVKAAADLTLLVYLYTVASRYPMRAGVLATAVVEAGTVMAAIRWPLTRNWAAAWPPSAPGRSSDPSATWPCRR